jgi:tetratricopeptide (TPR) repeat protein
VYPAGVRVVAVLSPALLIACVGGDAAPDAGLAQDAAGADADPAELLVELGIARCQATLAGDTGGRQEALDTLVEAAAAAPESARVRIYLGMCSLAAVVEDGNFAAVANVEPALTEAIALDPDDRRIPGWLGVYKVNLAAVLGDGLPEAIAYMQAAADAYPEFNNVSLAIAFAPLPLESGYPAMAISALEAIEGCGATDPRCRNSDAVPHNVAGSLMLFGDVHARVGDAATAATYYQAALDDEAAATWPYRAEAQAALDDVVARAAAWSDADPANDPIFFAGGPHACRGCHE